MIAVPPWIILGAVAILVPIFVFWTLQNISKEREYVVRLLTEKGSALIRSIEAGTRTGMMGMRGGGFRVQRLISETAQTPDIVYLMVTDATGNIVAHSDEAEIGKTHGADLDLQRISRSEKVQWRQISRPDGASTFEVFRRFSPTRVPFRGPHGGRMQGPWPNEMREEIPPPEQPEIIFVGLDMGPIEAVRKQDTTNTILLASILLLIGFAGVVSLFLAQAYRSTRTSLTRIKAFSDNVVERMPVGLVALDGKGRIISFNRAAEATLRLPSYQVTGRTASEVLPRQVLDMVAALKDSTRTAIGKEFDCSFPDGRIVPLDVTLSSLKGEDGAVWGTIILCRDLTEVQSLKREVETSRRLASLGRLAAGVAHEIRNPLSSIKGFATYFKERYRDNPDDQKTSEIMIQEVDRLNRVITQLLEFARPPVIQKKRASLKSLIQHSLRMIERQASAKEIQVLSHLPSDVKEVDLDPDGINQVLLNLYLNAIEAMERGGTLTVSLYREERSPWVKIMVSDTGTGISKEDLDHVFDPYFTTKQTGTGLGLAIVHKIIEAHRGEVRAESEIGRGTTVSILLPVTEA
ncbi:MAG: signal transduction histidine kinase [Deltaproteobacteria bacterium]|nr:signal transduction histidine kinase [Deltaproteobacteria bacterium]